MPLLDHFHPPLEKVRPWEGIHSFWTSAIVQQLNRSLLPPGYVAMPQISLGSVVEADVAALQATNGSGQAEGGGAVAMATYAPPAPLLTVAVDFKELDVFEVQVFQESGGLNLVAVVELVSPANKDRPGNRQAFVRKCASYLQSDVAVLIVDVVTIRSGNLHAELIEVLAPTVEHELAETGLLYAAAYRLLHTESDNRVEVWPIPLEVGKPLATLPLWIAPDCAVPVDLEESYRATCESLRIRVA